MSRLTADSDVILDILSELLFWTGCKKRLWSYRMGYEKLLADNCTYTLSEDLIQPN